MLLLKRKLVFEASSGRESRVGMDQKQMKGMKRNTWKREESIAATSHNSLLVNTPTSCPAPQPCCFSSLFHLPRGNLPIIPHQLLFSAGQPSSMGSSCHLVAMYEKLLKRLLAPKSLSPVPIKRSFLHLGGCLPVQCLPSSHISKNHSVLPHPAL